MMNKLEEAIIYATVMHQGKVRKLGNTPFILHPLEVAQILSTMTDNEEIITAGILHDIVDDTDGTLEEIEKRYGIRVAELVSSVSEKTYSDEKTADTWKQRKEESLHFLKNNEDTGVHMIWLADTLANIRSLAGAYSEKGEGLWNELHQSDSAMQCWYYRSIAEMVELTLNKTGAFKELIKHINFIWPGTFDSEKSRYKKYREVSVDGCKLIGRGAKGEVYRYDDELVIKVFNYKNTYRDVEHEIALSRKAFIMGIPTAISFGIVSVGERYGAMYELVDSETISSCIERNPGQVDAYAKIMAELAHTIHSITVTEEDGFRNVLDRIKKRVSSGVRYEDAALAEKCLKLIDTIPVSDTLIHGDFHTGNVFMQRGEALLIDMDRVSTGHPITELSCLYYFYITLGEYDPAVVEDFMGFSYQTARQFYDSFIRSYLGTEDEQKIIEVSEKAAFLSYVRMIARIRKKAVLSENDHQNIAFYLEKIQTLLEKLDTLAF